MAFINESSCECMKSELDLFTVPPTQTSVDSGSWVEYHPISTITNTAPIEFDVSSSGEDYMDFANSNLYVRAKLQRANGANIEDGDEVGPVNNFLHVCFRRLMYH